MKVKELLEKLKELDPEAPVWVRDHEGDWVEMEDVDAHAADKTPWWPYDKRSKRVVVS